jgi:hypothetical protein
MHATPISLENVVDLSNPYLLKKLPLNQELEKRLDQKELT